MEEIILQRSITKSATDEPLAAEAVKAGNHFRTRLSSFKADSNLSWGRSRTGSLKTSLQCAGIMVLCPTLVIFTWIALENFNGSLLLALSTLLSLGPCDFAVRYAPPVSLKAFAGYTAWLVFQAILYTFLPSKLSTGQLTPAGHLLEYYTNGLLAWIVTHGIFGAAVFSGTIDPAIIANNWPGLLVATNIYGFILSTLAYLKAYHSPSHCGDRKFSGQCPNSITGAIPIDFV
jgi:7-dehydrocholesterol reductase